MAIDLQTLAADPLLLDARQRLSATRHVLIAGVGNELRTDDGFGVHVVRALAQRGVGKLEEPVPLAAGRELWVADVGTAAFGTTDLVDWADAMVAVDAVLSGRKVGELLLLDTANLPAASRPAELHALELRTFAALLPGKVPPPLWILGIEPQDMNYGLTLTEPIAARVDDACATLQWLLGIEPARMGSR